MRARIAIAALAAAALFIPVAPGVASAAPAPSTGSPPPAQPAPGPAAQPAPHAAALADPAAVLPKDWRTSTDHAVAVTGDQNGLHLLVADESAGYAWRTAATLADNTYDADSWIGQACVTGSGQRAVVVYAPRTFVNSSAAMDGGGLVAIVDLASGAVTKLSLRASLAYFDPGCGTTETVALTTLDETVAPVRTTVTLLDAATGKTVVKPTVTGQLTSAVPAGTGVVVGALGTDLVQVGAPGAVRTLVAGKAVPFRLHPDRAGGVGYELATGSDAQVRRFAGGHDTLLGTGPLQGVQLTGSAGNVWVIGADRNRVPTAGLAGWAAVDAPVGAAVSTTGTLAVTATTRADAEGPRYDQAQPVAIAAKIAGASSAVSFTVHPDPGTANGASLAGGASAVKGATRSGGVASPALANSSDPTDPDRGCAVARNNVNQQTYQATAKQVEWAADLAVKHNLTITRSANWNGAGNTSYKIQGSGSLFDLLPISGGGQVPAQVLLGVLAQESNTMQASPHAVDGETGNFNQGGFYGDDITWKKVDCGYGVGQVTSGMAVADGVLTYSAQQQLAIATDYAANIAASLNALILKWNQLWAAGITANDKSPQYLENWYLAAWAYNTGVQPNAANGNTSNCPPSPTCTDGEKPAHWGLGWSNNPANPGYPEDRAYFNGQDPNDTKHPNEWPYQEKVLGWAYTTVSRYDYAALTWAPAFAPASNGTRPPSQPPSMTFCSLVVDLCQPGVGTDVNGKPGAGYCTLGDLHCWWHQPVNWLVSGACNSTICGTEVVTFHSGDPEPTRPDVYPANCSTTGLPSGSKIIDDTTTVDPVASCPNNWTVGGTFALAFAQSQPTNGCTVSCITYQSKIDFHQIGGSGFGGHFWFAHTYSPSPSQVNLAVTGTWTLDAPNAWTRLFVHLPAVGAQTHQAKYVITLPNGQQKYRVITTPYEANTWVDIGVYDLRGATRPTVALSNITPDGNGSMDIAYDAIAYKALPAKPANFVVALGDSYSSGEGTGDYYHQTDQYGDNNGLREACRRSPNSWQRQVKLPNQTRTIGQLADSLDPTTSFAFASCSGARTYNVASRAEVWATYGGSAPSDLWGEAPQLDQGLLDENTTLVLLTIGGNDAGFTDIVKSCAFGVCSGTATSIEQQMLNQVEPRVADVLDEIRERAPNALVVLAGYPRLFNDSTLLDNGCQYDGIGALCGLINSNQWSLSQSETTMLNQVADYLSTEVLSMVTDLDARILGVDVRPSFLSHTIGIWSDSDYLNAITMPNFVANSSGTPTATDGQPIGMGSFHPTTAGALNGYAVPVTGAIAAYYQG